MKKASYTQISFGHVVASWYLIFLANRHRGLLVRDAISIVEKSGKLGGTVPAQEGLKVGLSYGLLRIFEGKIIVTDVAETILIPQCHEEDLNISGLRAFLHHVLSNHNYEWLIYYDSDPGIFRANLLEIEPEWTNLFDNASLFNFEDEEVLTWWDAILSKYEDFKEQLKKAIGDVGEKLTYNHELSRVEIDGFNPAKTFVKWASRISNQFGFDILSVRGKYFLESFDKNDKIQIEVKSTDADNMVRFRFYISKPEWNKALDNLDTYFFFCWTGINLENETARNGPFVIPAKSLVQYMPIDSSELCQWSECRCVIDLTSYSKVGPTSMD